MKPTHFPFACMTECARRGIYRCLIKLMACSHQVLPGPKFAILLCGWDYRNRVATLPERQENESLVDNEHLHQNAGHSSE